MSDKPKFPVFGDEWLEPFLKSCTPNQRAIAELFMQEKKMSEIARLRGVTPASVRQTRTALKRLVARAVAQINFKDFVSDLGK